MVKVFVSRELAVDSAFYRLLPTDKVHVIAESLLAFEGIAFSALPEADWCFFSSKNAVRYFCAGLKEKGITLHHNLRLAVLGEGTAKALKEQGFVADFAGNGDPVTVGEAFGRLAEAQRVLFPRAASSRESIQKILAGRVTIIDLVVYTNSVRLDFELPKADLLVFTSPLNAQAYYNKYPARADQMVLAIGQSTAQALQELGLDQVSIAPTPSEEVLAEQCKALLNL